MRLVLYNIRYGTGADWHFHLPVPMSGYLRRTPNKIKQITAFFQSLDPDIIGLIEVDSGSYRSDKQNQAIQIAQALDFDHYYMSKYAKNSVANAIPVLNQQGNAFLTRHITRPPRFHYFTEGLKRLVIELEFDRFVVFLVHLAITFRSRQYQLQTLYSLFQETEKPAIVAGDFNALWGDRELALFMAATGLKNANTSGLPTFPAMAPIRQLDFILHDPRIRVTRFEIPRVKHSDHLPLVCDFELDD
jgi:endonuclease/exonuclease/phosphatase family metal-dependent hydrolase